MPTYKGKHPRNLPTSFYKPIGQLIARWGFTELYLQSIVWHVWKIRDAKAARLLTWDLNAVSKVELFGFLAPKWIVDPEDQAELRRIAAEANRLRAVRNKVAHGLWAYKPGEPKRLLLANLRRDNRIHPKAEPISSAQLSAWANELDLLNKRLVAFHRHLGAPVP